MNRTSQVFDAVAARRLSPEEGARLLCPPRPRPYLLAVALGCAVAVIALLITEAL